MLYSKLSVQEIYPRQIKGLQQIRSILICQDFVHRGVFSIGRWKHNASRKSWKKYKNNKLQTIFFGFELVV